MKKILLSLGIILTAAVSYGADSQVTKLSTVTWNQTQKTDVLYLATGVSTVSASKQISLLDVVNSTYSTYYIPYSSASTSYLGISSGPVAWPGFTVAASSAVASQVVSTMNVNSEYTWTVLGGTATLGVNKFNMFASPWNLYVTGSSRLSISADTTNTTYQTGLGNNLLFVGPANTTALATGNIQFKNLSTFSTNSAGQSVFLAVTPTINSNTTGGNTDFLVNRAETSVGSGSQLLADFQVSNTSKFKIDNTGAATSVGGFVSTGNNFLATVNNTSSANNARIQLLSSGVSINRNIADQNPALIANQINASSTGDLMNFQAASVSKASVTANGGIVISSEIFSSGSLPIASTNTAIGMFGTVVNGQGSAITAGSTVAITVPYDCSITSATVMELSGTSGSISVDVKRIAFSNSIDYTSFVSIVGASGNKPSLVSQQVSAIKPTSWTSTQLLAGDVLAFVVDSASSVKLVSVTLWTRKN